MHNLLLAYVSIVRQHSLKLSKFVVSCKQVKFKVVGRHNARLSPLMKDVLEMKKPRCEMQLFQMFLPIK